MAEGFGLKVLTEPTRAVLDDVKRRADRASMWALRETARQAKSAAKKNARVYRGSDPRVVPGQLKKSIRTSKMRKVGYRRVIRVYPAYPGVLYAAKIEALEPFMRPAYEVGLANHRENHVKATRRAMERR